MLTTKFGRGKGLITGNDKNDKCYTPDKIVKQIINLFPIKDGDFVLDAFAGKKVFYDNYPNFVKKDWCEIDYGKDFFEYSNKVDWIITNPPYSIFDEVLQHSFEISDNIVYLVPQCGFPFGFPCCVIWIPKNYKGETKIKELKE